MIFIFNAIKNWSINAINMYVYTIVLKTIHFIHTYIIGHYNPSVRIIDIVSHSTYVVCVHFIYKWRDLQFKVNSERQILLRKFLWYLLTHRVFPRNLRRDNRRRNTFYILFWCQAWGSNPGLSSNKNISEI